MGRAGLSSLAVLLCVSVAMAPTAFAGILHDPYLQKPDDDTSTITVRWFTTEPADSWVDYGLTESYGNTTGTSEADTLHEVGLSGLAPNTLYHYRVRSGGEASGDYTFKTEEASSSTEFTFIAYGDSRSHPSQHGAVVSTVLDWNPEPSFVLHVGDVVYTGDHVDEWHDHFFAPGNPLFSRSPVIVSPGNHEHVDGIIFRKLPEEWFRYLTLPSVGGVGDERWYSFDCGSAHVVGLDSNVYEGANPRHADSMEVWLTDDLLAATSSGDKWLVAFMHHPPYNAGGHDSSIPTRNALCPIFDAFGVHLVFCGHNHFYQRTYPIRDGAATSVSLSDYHAHEGTIYVTTGGGGAPLYTPEGEWFVADMAMAYHFVEVDVSPLALSIKTVDSSGTVLDEFTITKPPAFVPPAAPSPQGSTPRLARLNVDPCPVEYGRPLRVTLSTEPEAGSHGDQVRISVHDALGRRLGTIWSGVITSDTGSIEFEWSGSLGDGERLAPGVYFLYAGHPRGLQVAPAKLVVVP